MKKVESAWIMLRPGLMVARSSVCCTEARFGFDFGEFGWMHQLSTPSLFLRGRQRSSRNAWAVGTQSTSRRTTKMFRRMPRSD